MSRSSGREIYAWPMTLGRNGSRKKGRSAGSSSSRHVHHLSMSQSSSGIVIPRKESLTAINIQRRQRQERLDHQQSHNGMTPTQMCEIAAIQSNLAANLPEDGSEDGWMDIGDVLTGQTVLDVSHAGGEFTEMVDLAEDMLQTSRRQVRWFINMQFLLTNV